jgi:uncharacterized protein YbjT (DUF2867 family)
MKVILFGATGMVGQGVLRECLLDPAVERVLVIGRTPIRQQHEKLREIVRAEVTALDADEAQLQGCDACFFCLGVSSAGMTEANYRHVTFDLTVAVAQRLARLNPAMTFIYVTGAGTDSTTQGRSMWARVKGETENALLQLPFKAAVMFRPGLIQPLHGIRSKTWLYRIVYVVMVPVLALLKRIAPDWLTTTEVIGRAMIVVARHGAPQPILGTREINAVGRLRQVTGG